MSKDYYAKGTPLVETHLIQKVLKVLSGMLKSRGFWKAGELLCSVASNVIQQNCATVHLISKRCIFKSSSPSYGVSGGPAISPLSSVKFSSTRSTFIWFLLVWKGEKWRSTVTQVNRFSSIHLACCQTNLQMRQNLTPHVLVELVDPNLLHIYRFIL